MNQDYQVRWARSAVDDLEDIIDYIAQDSPLAAQRLFEQIKTKIETLSHSPQRGRRIPELQQQGILTYRELIVPPWRVMYRVSEETVYVLAIIDSRRNVEDILLERLFRKK